jgi:hypothetical protein
MTIEVTRRCEECGTEIEYRNYTPIQFQRDTAIPPCARCADVIDRIVRSIDIARGIIRGVDGLRPNTMDATDEVIRALGGNPEDFPQIEGAPGWRRVIRP